MATNDVLDSRSGRAYLSLQTPIRPENEGGPMIAFALQAATARAMGSHADASVADAPELLRVFHPPGVIRLVTPDEAAARQGGAYAALPASAPSILPLAVASVAGALRRLSHLWGEAQGHRGGL
jgi:hypothetical protein